LRPQDNKSWPRDKLKLQMSPLRHRSTPTVNITTYLIPFPIFSHNPLVHRRYNFSRWWSILNFNGNINNATAEINIKIIAVLLHFDKFKRGPSFAVYKYALLWSMSTNMLRMALPISDWFPSSKRGAFWRKN
jgi:hypothetical protein